MQRTTVGTSPFQTLSTEVWLVNRVSRSRYGSAAVTMGSAARAAASIARHLRTQRVGGGRHVEAQQVGRPQRAGVPVRGGPADGQVGGQLGQGEPGPLDRERLEDRGGPLHSLDRRRVTGRLVDSARHRVTPHSPPSTERRTLPSTDRIRRHGHHTTPPTSPPQPASRPTTDRPGTRPVPHGDARCPDRSWRIAAPGGAICHRIAAPGRGAGAGYAGPPAPEPGTGGGPAASASCRCTSPLSQ